MVGLIGLKTSFPERSGNNFKEGEYVGFFKIYKILENEVILGADDNHLNFRVSIYNSRELQFNIKVTTLVQYHNLKGKAYMFFIKPFHRIVLKSLINQAYLK